MLTIGDFNSFWGFLGHPVSGLPDCMHKLAKLLTMLFVFLCICLLFSLFL